MEARQTPFWHALSERTASWRIRISAAVLGVLVVQNWLLQTVPSSIPALTDPLGLLALTLIALGLALRSWAAGTLRKGVALTTWGPYRLCRNPLYLGTILLISGFCALVPHVLNVLVLGIAVTAGYALTILREERRLAIKYGEAWENYAASTPRLLPLGLGAGTVARWSFSQWFRSREYWPILTAPLALVGLVLWHQCS
jgi:protein-S-isoprenylcysteine O-methyltransferase Ste14